MNTLLIILNQLNVLQNVLNHIHISLMVIV